MNICKIHQSRKDIGELHQGVSRSLFLINPGQLTINGTLGPSSVACILLAPEVPLSEAKITMVFSLFQDHKAAISDPLSIYIKI